MKNFLDKTLCNQPKIYAILLKLLGRKNHEKIFYLNLIKKNDVVIEIGANRGYFTKLFSNIVGNLGHVYAFEAVKKTYHINKDNFQGPPPANLELNNLAVGDQNTQIEILVPAGDDGQASLKAHSEGSWKNGYAESLICQMVRLDDYFLDKNITRIDFIKCDIEGAELLAMHGFENTLRKFIPKMLIEVNNNWTTAFGYDSKQLVNYLKELGYTSFYEVEEDVKKLSDSELKNISTINEGINLFCL
tara:strand:+ start:350 stop:1087 length:738 start_codon:yes stop_codon:yes gene_type:complete